MDIRYLQNTDEIEITDDYGNPRYIPMSNLEIVDANERAYGTETEYRTSDGIHIFFYPDGIVSGWYNETEKQL